MPTPTEEGWFWYTPSDGPRRPQPMQIVRDAQGELHIGAPTCGSPHPGRAGGTWGERIPSSDQIKARREMAAHTPLVAGVFPTPGQCIYCYQRQEYGKPIKHNPDCPWPRAQERTT